MQERTKMVKEVIECINQGEVFTLNQMCEMLPQFQRRDISNSLQTLKDQSMFHAVPGKRCVYVRNLIQPKAAPASSEEQRIQNALMALGLGGKLRVSNLFAFNEWVEATKKLLREVK